ncbi:MAG: hypothetical protein BWX47_00991 [candidate division Hyd24-12 bacterium ADurb.Bin004]|nr:MAG: hypothetical protein BWX47_00991 [candidate division Hyd24-12 bacterium ADurb.Bin004]
MPGPLSARETRTSLSPALVIPFHSLMSSRPDPSRASLAFTMKLLKAWTICPSSASTFQRPPGAWTWSESCTPDPLMTSLAVLPSRLSRSRALFSTPLEPRESISS